MLAAALIHAAWEVGDFKHVGGASVTSLSGIQEPETGWLLCNGAAVSRTTYSKLFALIGTQYGVGDGSTTFNLPNSLDRFALGRGAVKVTTGEVFGTLTHVHTVASHTHTLGNHIHDHGNHAHNLAHVHSGSTSAPSADVLVVSPGNTGVGATGHGHSFTTNYINVVDSGGPSTTLTAAPIPDLTGATSPVTLSSDPAYLAVAGLLVRYA